VSDDSRTFLKQTALAALALGRRRVSRSRRNSGQRQAQHAFIGVGGMGGGNLRDIAKLGENVVALCDIDDERLGRPRHHSKADNSMTSARFSRRRKKISMPSSSARRTMPRRHLDHGHELGKHCYTRSRWRDDLRDPANAPACGREKLATSMGQSGHGAAASRGCRTPQAGVIGDVAEFTCGTTGPMSTGSKAWTGDGYAPVHKHITGLWLGPAPERPYHPTYHPFAWRAWQDFGTGALWGHGLPHRHLAFMGLKLGFPRPARPCPRDEQGTYPIWSTVTLPVPKRGKLPAVKLVLVRRQEGRQTQPAPEDLTKGLKLKDSGSLLYRQQRHASLARRQWLAPRM